MKKLIERLKFEQIFSSKNKRFWLTIVTLILAVTLGASFYFYKTNSISARMTTCRQKKDQICYKNLVMDTFNKKGLDQALKLVTVIYAQDSSFSSTCHDIGHLLGAATFELFKQGKSFKITPEVAFCSYGFYHGFMEQLASEGDITKARDFCTYVDAQISKETPDASLQCYHGIGHGWVNIHGDTSLLGNDLGIVQRGLALCEKVATNDSELSRCATGVFNGIAVFYENNEYNLKVNSKDPMWLCKKVDAKFQDPCYVSMNTVLYSVTGQNFAAAAKFIEGIKDGNIAAHAMINLSLPFSMAELNKEDHSSSIAVCRSLSKRIAGPCLQGFAFAFLEHGEPGKEYVKAIGFCRNNGLSRGEMETCLTYIYTYLPQWYPEAKAYEICAGEGTERPLCEKNVAIGLKGLNR